MKKQKIYKWIVICSLFTILYIDVLISSCSAENSQTVIEKYFAMSEGNSWTYKRKIVDDNKKEGLGSKVQEDTSINEITSILKTEKYIIAESQTVASDLKEPLFFYSIVVDNKVYSFNPNVVLGDVPRRYDLDKLASWLEKRGTLGELEDQIFSYPIEVGQTWKGTESEGTYTVEKQEDIMTSAGVFKNCYEISYKSKYYESTDWFCPDIGSVKTEWRNTGKHKTYGVNELVEYKIKYKN